MVGVKYASLTPDHDSGRLTIYHVTYEHCVSVLPLARYGQAENSLVCRQLKQLQCSSRRPSLK